MDRNYNSDLNFFRARVFQNKETIQIDELGMPDQSMIIYKHHLEDLIDLLQEVSVDVQED